MNRTELLIAFILVWGMGFFIGLLVDWFSCWSNNMGRVKIEIQTCPWKGAVKPEWETIAVFYDYKVATLYLTALMNGPEINSNFYRIVEKNS